ncbi:MAG: ribonuclease PH [Phycisphaerae bacterium]|nr:ribonuclease PH [Phycisphaerae bacterium]
MTNALRQDGRQPGQLRPIAITPGFVASADGSCLIAQGGTRVICTASFVAGVPAWREGSGAGWLTAEYGMLPASTSQRRPRPGAHPHSRDVEIRRLIGRVLRNVVDLETIGPHTVYIDCDVLEADGGTRTASVTGAQVALACAAECAAAAGRCDAALTGSVAAVSVGLLDGQPVLDLDYAEDVRAEVDMNVAMTAEEQFVEIQGTAEGRAFGGDELHAMLDLARCGCRDLLVVQREALSARASQ